DHVAVMQQAAAGAVAGGIAAGAGGQGVDRLHAAFVHESLPHISTWLALPCRGRQVVARGAAPAWLAGQAARCRMAATARQPFLAPQSRVHPWTLPACGSVCLPASLRHHSVVDGRPLLRSSLACAQTAPDAGLAEIWGRLLAVACRLSAGCAARRGSGCSPASPRRRPAQSLPPRP